MAQKMHREKYLTLRDLADELNVKKTTIRSWEHDYVPMRSSKNYVTSEVAMFARIKELVSGQHVDHAHVREILACEGFFDQYTVKNQPEESQNFIAASLDNNGKLDGCRHAEELKKLVVEIRSKAEVLKNLLTQCSGADAACQFGGDTPMQEEHSL